MSALEMMGTQKRGHQTSLRKRITQEELLILSLKETMKGFQ